MVYSDFFDRVKSINGWLQEYKKYIKELAQRSKFTPEEIEEYKTNFFALEMLASKNDYLISGYPNSQNYDMKEIMALRPVVEEIIKMFQQTGDRKRYLDKISTLSLTAIIRICQSRLNRQEEAQLIPSVVATTDAIFSVVDNDPNERYVDSNTGLVAVEEITYKYPDTIKIVRDLTTQAVFKKEMKDGFNNQGVLERTSKKGGSLRAVLINDDLNEANTEKQLSYHEWAVMEACYALYLAGNNNIDLDSIMRVMKHSRKKTQSENKKTNIEKTKLYNSIRKLCSNHISIMDENCDFYEEDNLIDGELRTDSSTGKLYLHMNEAPILCRHADKISHINTYSFEELELIDTNYNDNTISIYRYLIAEVSARFGTIKKDEYRNGKTRNKNNNNSPITSKKICKDIIGERNHSKEQTIRKRIPEILNEMIRLGFIDRFEIIGEGYNTAYIVFRDEDNS